MSKKIFICRIFLVLTVICSVITLAALILGGGKTNWGGLFWWGAHMFLLASVLVLMSDD